MREARDAGLPAYAETCHQYLFLDYTDYEKEGFEGSKFVMSPPLRDKWHQEALWKGLAGNDLQVVSTDHCQFCMKEKEMGKDNFSKIPNGAPGIETRMSLLYSGVLGGKISLNRFVELTSTNPAKLMGLYPQKGSINIGGDGDIVVFDPSATMILRQKDLHMNVDYNPYEGREVKGVPTTVLSRGKVIIDQGKYLGKVGEGQFVPRQTYTLV